MIWAFIVTALAYYVGIGLAVVFHFRSRARPLRFLILTAATAVNLAVCFYDLWTVRERPFQLMAAFFLVVLASALFVWAVSASREARLKLIYDAADPHRLVESGPFRYIRHPFYASYCLFWIGCAVATVNPINLAFAAVIVPVFAVAARAEERSFEATPMADAYAAYRGRAGFFWPKW